jgi:hypothetical protein
VPKQFLDGLQIVTGKEQVTGKGVAKKVRRHAFVDAGANGGLLNRALNMAFVDVVSALFPGLRDEGELSGGKEPLPNPLPRGVLVFPFELSCKEDSGVTDG